MAGIDTSILGHCVQLLQDGIPAHIDGSLQNRILTCASNQRPAPLSLMGGPWTETFAAYVAELHHSTLENLTRGTLRRH